MEHIRSVGAERVLFGTNYPLVDQSDYVAAFNGLGLSPREVELIGHENALTLYGLSA